MTDSPYLCSWGVGAYMMLWRLGTQYEMIFIGTEI